MTNQLTVIIPCKNERRNILPCIEAASSVADELLVADSGSDDGTVEVAMASGKCEVIAHDWQGYSEFKNWAISQATHPWVLIVDADERVTPALAGEIRQVLENPSPTIDAYRIRHRMFFLGHEIRFSGRNTTSACRLIRRGSCRYKDVRVHEDISLPAERVGYLKERFVHFEFTGYDHYLTKRLKYTALAAQDRWEAGKRTGYLQLAITPFLRFFQLYFLRLGFLDGLPGLQLCMLTAFFNTFVKQGRLWELEHAIPQRQLEERFSTQHDRAETSVGARTPSDAAA